MTQKERAKAFSTLHRAEKLFVLPNIWNVGSAVVFAKQGFPAIATSSAGVAYDMGYPDGEDITFGDLLDVVERISKRVSVPLSVDFERGYAETPEQVKENARFLLEAGAVGFNIEDGFADGTLSKVPFQLEKLRALAELKAETGIDFVINARTCVCWYNTWGDMRASIADAIERINEYARVEGVNCVFVPGVFTLEEVKGLLRNIAAPLNIILNNRSGRISELDKAGVRRLSVGSAPVRYVYHEAIKIATDLKNEKTHALLSNPFTYKEAQKYFSE
ncbi:MAG: isocitrate lyase/phosphoenolpyruvate mutase family protein [Capnocytophaga sp.]|nr:isocitrate lyase/phosphoenolpyruvate mutase family protein [Capnocytophaga sp.]